MLWKLKLFVNKFVLSQLLLFSLKLLFTAFVCMDAFRLVIGFCVIFFVACNVNGFQLGFIWLSSRRF